MNFDPTIIFILFTYSRRAKESKSPKLQTLTQETIFQSNFDRLSPFEWKDFKDLKI